MRTLLAEKADRDNVKPQSGYTPEWDEMSQFPLASPATGEKVGGAG